MDLINFSINENNFIKYMNIQSVLLFGFSECHDNAAITICIPTYKRPRLLRDALLSASNQDTDTSYQIIVVDNDSDFENTEVLDIIKSLNIKNIAYYKNKKNLLFTGNVNRCIFLAKTRWTALLHDDDLLKSNYIADISKILDDYGDNIDGLSVGFDMINYPFKTINQEKSKFLRKIHKFLKERTKKMVKIPLSANLFCGNIYMAPTCGMVFRRESFINSGGIDQDKPSNDWAFNIFFSQKYKFYKYRESMGVYRWEVNYILQEAGLEEAKNGRKIILLSLQKYSKICRIIMFMFKRSFKQIMEAPFEAPLEHLRFFHTIRRLYEIFYH
jgi:glycosyltransferase involved in cell wall biosynthesis